MNTDRSFFKQFYNAKYNNIRHDNQPTTDQVF